LGYSTNWIREKNVRGYRNQFNSRTKDYDEDSLRTGFPEHSDFAPFAGASRRLSVPESLFAGCDEECLCFSPCGLTKKKFTERAQTFFNGCEENLAVSERLLF